MLDASSTHGSDELANEQDATDRRESYKVESLANLQDTMEEGKKAKTPEAGLPDPEDMSAEEIEKEKKNMIKNIILISLCFLLNFNAFQSLSRLQSSLHRDEGMGTINSSVLYGALVLSCLFLPKIMINLIGHRLTIPLSFCGYILWMAANGYAVWGTMVPASIIVGLAAAPLWTAQCSYFTILASRYARLTKDSEEAVVTRFFGIFFFFFQLSSITGSIISSTILYPKVVNGSEEIDPENLKWCGINDCPDNPLNETTIEDPSDATVWTMLGVFIAIAVCAVVIMLVFVDNLPKSLLHDEVVTCQESMNLLVATAKHLRYKEQLILIPITMYSGFEQASYAAEFTKSFVTCSLGIWKVGLVTIPFGVVNAIVSFTSGRVAKYTGRIPIFTAGLIVDLAIQITLLSWMPTPEEEYVLYILAGMWGFTDGIWQTQLNALYGSVFTEESEAAFSNYRMWESLGFIIAFAYSAAICTEYKLYVLLSFLCIGLTLYYVVEYLYYKENKVSNIAIATDSTLEMKKKEPSNVEVTSFNKTNSE